MISSFYRDITKVFLIVSLIFISCSLFSKVEKYGEVSFENRAFSEKGLFGQDKNHSSFTLSPEFYFESEDQKESQPKSGKSKVNKNGVGVWLAGGPAGGTPLLIWF